MYVIIAFAVALLVIALAWRGFGVSGPDADERAYRHPSQQPRQPRPPRRPSTRVVAPDDDPDFLADIDRKLRGEDKK